MIWAILLLSYRPKEGSPLQSTYSHAPLASSSGARLRHRVEKRLRTLHAAGLARTITDLDMIGPVTARSRSGQIYTVFSSNNYLGLTHHPKVLQAAADALIKGGTSSTGSRLISGGIARGSDLEKKLARFKGCEAALLFNTGYLANLGALYTLLKKGDLVFSDELNHASIIDGCRISGAEVIVYRHNDMTDLEQKLAAYASNQTAVKLIVTDGVFSMDGDLCRLPELAALKNRYGTLLMVDDAHAEGVIGPGGRGTEAYFGLQGTIDIQTGTLSKSLASEGGYVASSKEIIAYLTCRARPFVFSTFISPHDTAAAYAALQVLQEEGPILMKTLREHTRFMREGLHTLKLPVLPGITPLIPIIVGSVERAAAIDAFLKERGILLSAIRPPSVPMGTARLRLTLSAAHTKPQLQQVLSLLKEAWQQIP